MKFNSYKLTFQEIPDEISLCFSITGCVNNCKNCHSPELRSNIGIDLTIDIINEIIKKNKFITCITFMGGDQNENELILLLKHIKTKNLKTALYSGKNEINNNLISYLDYYKIGEYKESLGGLKSKTTNQKFFSINKVGFGPKRNNNNIYNLNIKEDITYKFQNNI